MNAPRMLRADAGGLRPTRSSSRPPGSCFRARGFTLIELLVVISIIALLISILIPSLSRARARARSVKCLSNLRGMGQASLLFANDHRGRFQVAALDVDQIDPGHSRFEYSPGGEILAWPVALAKASGIQNYKYNWDWGVRADSFLEATQREAKMDPDFELAQCPADLVRISSPFYPDESSMIELPPNEQTFDGIRYWGYLSYGLNEDVCGAPDDVTPGDNGFPDCWRYDPIAGRERRGQRHPDAGERLLGNLDLVFDPSSCLLMADAGPDNDADAMESGDDEYLYANLIISAQAAGPFLGDSVLKWPDRFPFRRHPDAGLNVLYCDFHAESAKAVEYVRSEVDPFPIPKRYSPRSRVSPYPPTRQTQ